ncbi:MAG: hypothetical protein WKG00_25980 [Polyangiaceae bacterium]
MMLSGADPAREPRPAGDDEAGGEPARVAVPDFAAVYEQHFDFLWRSVRRLGVADAHVDDVVQEVLLVVHRRLESFGGRSSL